MDPDEESEASKRRRSDASPDNASPKSSEELGFGRPTAASSQEQQSIDFAWDGKPPASLSAEEPESLVPPAQDALQASPAQADVGPPPTPKTTASADEIRVARDHIQHLGGWFEEEIAGWSDERVLLADAILVGSAQELLRAFEDAPTSARWVILRARLKSELRERLSGSLAWALLVAQLQLPARAAEVRLELLAAWTWLAESEVKPRALLALLDEAQARGDWKYGRSLVKEVLPSFSSDQLGRFLHQAAGRGRAAWEVFVDGMEDVQARGDQIPLSQFAQLLIDIRVEEWVKEQLAQILRDRASSMTIKADLAEMVAELAQRASAAEAEELARRVYVPVLKNVDDRPHLASGEAATEWVLAHPSAVKGDPSAWDIYLCIVRTSKYLHLSGRVSEERVRNYRVQSLQCLAELAPILPLERVKEIQHQLFERYSNPDVELDEDVCKAAREALGPIQLRLREAQAEVTDEQPRNGAPPESATRLGAPEWTSWPTPPGEAIIRFATSPRFPPLIYLPIHDSLTVSPGSGPIPPVERIDASQGGLGPAAAPPPDLDLSSSQITMNSAGDGFSPTRSSTATTAVPGDRVDLASASLTTSEPFVLRIYTGESPEEERFIQQFRAVASLVESGEVNTEVLADSMAGLIMAYRDMGGAIPDGAGSERVLPGRLPRHIQEHPEKREAASKPVMLSAQETIERFKALRERGEIDAFLQRFVVGKTWNKLQDNKDVAYNLSKHLQNLDLRFSCVNDGTASSLRCFPTTGNKNGSFYFQHYGDGQKHGGSPTIPDLKTVPAPLDQRRGTSKSK